MLGFIATDMYLPAFKAIEVSLDATAPQIAMSLTSFLAGLAIGQLLYGPLVNKFGKRAALLFGLCVFGCASLAIAYSDSVMMLNIARFFQAIGACGAAVIWQTLVVERYDAEKAQGVFSNIMPLVALSPALAPLLGAAILQHFGWSAIFITLVAIAVLLMAMTIALVPKEIKHKQDNATKVSYKELFSNMTFLGNVIIFGACSGAFFSYLTVWPIVMEQHGYAAAEIGLSFIPQTIMFIVGGYTSKLLISRIGAKSSLTVLLALFGLCVVAIILATLVLDVQTIFPLLIAFSVLAAANGAIYPIVVNNALQQFTQNATKAAGLQNFLQISIAFGASSVVAKWAAAGDVAIGWGILICGVGVLIGYFLKDAKCGNPLVTPDNARASLHSSNK